MTETRTEPILVSTRTEVIVLQSSIFGELVKLATDTVEHYHGDLFHDATWIRSHVTETLVFYWSCDDYGTQIGTDRDLVQTYRTGPMVKVTVEPVFTSWQATVERIR